jgi:hypothetical protein
LPLKILVKKLVEELLTKVMFAKVELPDTLSVPPKVVLPETLKAERTVDEPFTKSAEVVAPIAVRFVMMPLVAPKDVVVPLANEKLVPEIAVVDAYGNCDAATVDEEKKTPWVQILEEVAAVVVANVIAVLKGYAAIVAEVR